MSVLPNAIGYGVGFAARSYFGVSYIRQVQQGLEKLLSRIASSRIGPTMGSFVGKQVSYVLAFPCVNLAGEVVSFVTGAIVSRAIGFAIQKWRGKEEEEISYLALVTGGIFAFVVKNTVAFHAVESLYEAIREGAARATLIYLGKERTMAGPISSAVGLQAATWGAFPAASFVGDTVGWGVKKGCHKSIGFIESRCRQYRSSGNGEEGEPQTSSVEK